MNLAHENATPRALAVWRVYLLAIFIVWMARYDWSLITWLPREQLRPDGILGVPFLLHVLLSHGVLRGLQVTAFCLAALGILNIWTHWSVLLVTVLNLIYYRLNITPFFNTHGGLPIIFGGFILAGALFLEHRERSRGTEGSNHAPAALQLTALALLTTYSLVGVHRIAFAGLETLRADYLVGWLIERGGSGYFQYSLQIQDHPRFLRVLELGFPFVTLLEVLAPFALVSRPIKWVFLLTAIPFHLGTWLLMNIFFWQNLLILPLLLFDFSVLCHPRRLEQIPLQKTKMAREPA